MKFPGNSSMRIKICAPALLAWTFTMAIGPDLGSGHRGLVFAQITEERSTPKITALIACRMNPGYPHGGSFLESHESINTIIIAKETFSQKNIDDMGGKFFNGWSSRVLYSLSPDMAFAYQDLYTVENGHIRIYPGQAQTEARKRFRLKDDQVFLGAFENRVYFWVRGKPTEVLFRTSDHLYRLRLNRRVTEPLGMSKGDPDGDLALFRVAKPKGCISMSPRSVGWDVLNLKEAERIE